MYISNLIEVASVQVENIVNKTLIASRVREVFELNNELIFKLKLNDYEGVEIFSVKLLAEDESELSIDFEYEFDKGFINLFGDDFQDAYSVEIIYDTKESDYLVIPESFKQACLIIIGDLFSNRQDIVIGRSTTNIKVVEYLLQPYKNKILM
ncbi:phage gp6-like head-tail connector protein [Belliella sp. DSM 107340]|uniref:Phage gp6-like head-tail connector protein n=2 Tax=Belliella calami TaxID=2923436 RepID=A0ABS9UJM2_9BACT|nr:head-tail connector protein [Belliella calami]MCH7396564.1 phage gp6-like head-tail connector protein [Belliella calami]